MLSFLLELQLFAGNVLLLVKVQILLVV